MGLFHLELRMRCHSRSLSTPVRSEPSIISSGRGLSACPHDDVSPPEKVADDDGGSVSELADCSAAPSSSVARVPVPDSAFVRACRGQPVETVPVWFMRQAGRSLPEYRAARGEGSVLDAIRQPELAAELTLQPVRRYGVDAAILFSDIVVPAAAVGFGLEVEPGRGPVVERPFRRAEDLARLRPFEPEADAGYVLETVRLVTKELDPLGIPLIGFAGAPFTVASYLVEGGPSRAYAHTKALMRGHPALFGRLLDVLADMALASLRAQVRAGASAVQLFDSWVGALSPVDYEHHVLPATRKVFEGLADLGVPRIHFGVGTGELLALMAGAGVEVVGVDWRVPLDEARRRVGPEYALQGNLDPTTCLAPWAVVEAQTRDVLERGGGTGHVFNLGHGVLPETDPDVLARIVELVHKTASARASTLREAR
jgi:uroporphyrinogen decarboxylase